MTARRDNQPSHTWHPQSWLLAISIIVLLLPKLIQAAERPIALHEGNPHYFVWHGKPTVLITSGEHYGALLNLDFDYVRYFDTLAADKLNHTRTFSGTYRETLDSFGITDNTLAPKPNRFICPWARSDQPGYFDAGNRFDLDRWDEDYFRRLRDFMAEAKQRGIVVEMTLFCPMYKDSMWDASPMNTANNVNKLPACPREEVFTLKHPKLLAMQLALTRKIVTELKDYDNLYYEICNEPYFAGVTMPWQERIIDEIVATEKDYRYQHLISLNIANGRKKVVNPHRAVSIFNFHYCVPPDTVAMNYGLDKVIGENETGFRGKADVIYRTEGWDFILAGGALYNNLDYSFTAKHPDGTLSDYRSPGGGSPALRQQLRILRDFIYSFDFVAMCPDQSVLINVPKGIQSRTLAKTGEAYAIYFHVALPKKPKPNQLHKAVQTSIRVHLPAGRYQAQWIDTKTGKIDKSITFDHEGGKKNLKSPKFVVDVALRIRRQ